MFPAVRARLRTRTGETSRGDRLKTCVSRQGREGGDLWSGGRSSLKPVSAAALLPKVKVS